MSKTLKAVYGSLDRPLKISDISLPCYVLEDGTRVLVQRGMQMGIGMSESGGTKTDGTHRLGRFVSSDAIKPFLNEETISRINNPISFQIGGKKVYGYEATLLPELCDAIVQARDEGTLLKQQKHIGDQALKLLRAFARVGIIALVDEATGYQEIREKDELQRILKAYISPELLPWTLTFPREFYEEMYRLNGWKLDPAVRTKYSVVGKYTNKYVYEQLPGGVLEELKETTPKSKKGNYLSKFHQRLTNDIGNPHLRTQIFTVIKLMKISRDRRDFQSKFAQAFPEPEQSIQEPLLVVDEEIEKKPE